MNFRYMGRFLKTTLSYKKSSIQIFVDRLLPLACRQIMTSTSKNDSNIKSFHVSENRKAHNDRSADRHLQAMWMKRYMNGETLNIRSFSFQENFCLLHLIVDVLKTDHESQRIFVENGLVKYHINVLEMLTRLFGLAPNAGPDYLYRLCCLDKDFGDEKLVSKTLNASLLLKAATVSARRCQDVVKDIRHAKSFSILTKAIVYFQPVWLAAFEQNVEGIEDEKLDLEKFLIAAYQRYMQSMVHDPARMSAHNSNYALSISRRLVADLNIPLTDIINPRDFLQLLNINLQKSLQNFVSAKDQAMQLLSFWTTIDRLQLQDSKHDLDHKNWANFWLEHWLKLFEKYYTTFDVHFCNWFICTMIEVSCLIQTFSILEKHAPCILNHLETFPRTSGANQRKNISKLLSDNHGTLDDTLARQIIELIV